MPLRAALYAEVEKLSVQARQCPGEAGFACRLQFVRRRPGGPPARREHAAGTGFGMQMSNRCWIRAIL